MASLIGPKADVALAEEAAKAGSAVGVCVVATSYAVFAIAEAYVGPAGAAAVVAALFALIAVIIGALLMIAGYGRAAEHIEAAYGDA